MTQLGVTNGAGKEERYYTKLGRASDFILRCKDCRSIVRVEDIRKIGCCTCGNKRFAEIVTMTPEERENVAAMEFPYRDEFLAEFAAHE